MVPVLILRCLRRMLASLRAGVGGLLREASPDTAALGEHGCLRQEIDLRERNACGVQEEMRVLQSGLIFERTCSSEITRPIYFHIDPFGVGQVGAHETRGVRNVPSPALGANNLNALMAAQGNLEDERVPQLQPGTVLGANPARLIQRDADPVPAGLDANGAHPTLCNVLLPFSGAERAELPDLSALRGIAGQQNGIVPINIESCEFGSFYHCEFQPNLREVRTNEPVNKGPRGRTFATRIRHEGAIRPRQLPQADERRDRAALRSASTTPDFYVLHAASLQVWACKRNGQFVLNYAGGNA